MEQKIVHIGDMPIANDKPFTLFAGMNVLESRDLAIRICKALRGNREAGYPLCI